MPTVGNRLNCSRLYQGTIRLSGRGGMSNCYILGMHHSRGVSICLRREIGRIARRRILSGGCRGAVLVVSGGGVHSGGGLRRFIGNGRRCIVNHFSMVMLWAGLGRRDVDGEDHEFC